MTTSSQSGHIAICTYRVRSGNESNFENLLRQHWPTLHGLGLVTGTASQIYRGHDGEGPVYMEILEWVDAKAPEEAHHTPEVMKVWEPMGQLVESRSGRPPMEFPHFARLRL